jgi:ubiquinone/menaquinone biosynthesis C-methylase UbiE
MKDWKGAAWMACRVVRKLSLAVVPLAISWGGGLVLAQRSASAEAERLVETLELQPGDAVADIGAGAGDMSVAVAGLLGPQSRVYATEISKERLEDIRAAVARVDAGNVEVLEAHPTRTNLPEACCDAIFVRRVYHHFGNPAAMHQSIRRSLKPGGRFAVLDFPHRRATSDFVPPELRASGDSHGVNSETVVKELMEAGFEDVRLVTDDWPGGMFLVMARNP